MKVSNALSHNNAECHVMAFWPVSEAAHSWSYDNTLCMFFVRNDGRRRTIWQRSFWLQHVWWRFWPIFAGWTKPFCDTCTATHCVSRLYFPPHWFMLNIEILAHTQQNWLVDRITRLTRVNPRSRLHITDALVHAQPTLCLHWSTLMQNFFMQMLNSKHQNQWINDSNYFSSFLLHLRWLFVASESQRKWCSIVFQCTVEVVQKRIVAV